jgi:hypothetical protein
MAKKNVVIFDGEDKFINPKKAVYSKTRGQAKKVDSFKSVRAALEDEEGPTQAPSEVIQDAGSAPVYEPTPQTAAPASAYNEPTPTYSAPIYAPSPSEIASNISSVFSSPISNQEIRNTGMPNIGTSTVITDTAYSPLYDDRKTTMPVYEAPVEAVFRPTPEQPPAYVAPVPQLPVFGNDGNPPSLDARNPIYYTPNPVLDDRKSTMPVYEAPVEAVFRPSDNQELLPPRSVAPIPQLPSTPPSTTGRPCPQGMRLYMGTCIPIENEYSACDKGYMKEYIGGPCVPIPPADDYIGKAPIFDDRLPKDGLPTDRNIIVGPNPYQPNPIYTAPVPILPNPTTPPKSIIIADPMGGGGSPVMGGPEIPNIPCPPNFYPSPNGNCLPNEEIIYDKPISSDPCQGLAKPQLAPPPAGMKWIRKPDCTHVLVKDESQVIPDAPLPDTTSSTTSTTTKAPTTSTTTSTTTKAAVADKICNPPIYAAPKYYKWVSKGNCAYELVVDDTQLKDAAPAPVLPATGQPIININYPTGGLGTIPTSTTTSTSTTVQTTTKSLLPTGGDSGGAGGGGGGSPFPEEPAPIAEAPKKNYFWWYVGGALAIFLILKRKNKQ